MTLAIPTCHWHRLPTIDSTLVSHLPTIDSSIVSLFLARHRFHGGKSESEQCATSKLSLATRQPTRLPRPTLVSVLDVIDVPLSFRNDITSS